MKAGEVMLIATPKIIDKRTNYVQNFMLRM